MDETTNLLLPYILAAQAQKHVTHNEALRKLDAIVQISIIDRDLSSPPSSPVEGARYIVGASPAGAWIGHQNKIAAWQDGAWAFYGPRTGWMAWIEDEEAAVVWDGTAWTEFGGGSLTLNPATGGLVGVNATADTTNRLAVSSPASLFNHGGAGHQMKINKNAAADTGSILFQTSFSGRAEMGLAGSDDYSFKVSPDGSAWNNAILINRTNGACTFPATKLSQFAATTSAELRGVLSDETGNGALMFGTSPSVTTDIRPAANDGASLGILGTAFSDLFLAAGGVINWNNGAQTLTAAGASIATTGANTIVFEAPSATAENILRRTDAHGNATIGSFSFQGKDSAANTDVFAQLSCFVSDNTSTSEDALLQINLMRAGTFTTIYQMNNAAFRPQSDDGAALGVSGAAFSDLFLASGGVINWAAGDVTVTHSSNVLAFAGASSGYTFDDVVHAMSGTAIPAGGTAGKGFRLGSTSNFGIFFGSGAPTLSAAQGSLYLRSDGSSTSTRLYVNTNGSTTWTSVTTAA